jgi:hypothetical protein
MQHADIFGARRCTIVGRVKVEIPDQILSFDQSNSLILPCSLRLAILIAGYSFKFEFHEEDAVRRDVEGKKMSQSGGVHGNANMGRPVSN